MTNVDRWLLPDGVDEVLPEQAEVVESYRRKLLDLYYRWGYDLVIPPMLEFTESLLSGSGKDLDLMTFRLTDQISGRMMGVRADITPQTARMDAHSLHREGPSRLCYAGTVLHTRARGPLQSRAPISVGVELFGEQSLAADMEVIALFLETLKLSGVEQVTIDLGHVDILRGIVVEANLSVDQEGELFALLQRKAKAELTDWITDHVQREDLGSYLRALPNLAGGVEVINEAKALLKGASDLVQRALNQLDAVVALVQEMDAHVHIDLGEMPGYHYHTGIVFAAYVQGYGRALGNGGRYDHVGQEFGRARPATGFAFDLKSLVSQSHARYQRSQGIFVPFSNNTELSAQVDFLRSQGERVVFGFEGQYIDFQEMKCDRQLVEVDGQYVVRDLPQ